MAGHQGVHARRRRAMPGHDCRDSVTRMSLFIDIVLAGVVLGGMYALVAMGLTLQNGVARIMNLSHGESLIAAAFGGVWGLTAFAVSPLIELGRAHVRTP